MDPADYVFDGKRFRLTFPTRENLGIWYVHRMPGFTIRQVWRIRLITRR